MIRKDRKEGKKDERKLVKYPSLEEWINKLRYMLKVVKIKELDTLFLAWISLKNKIYWVLWNRLQNNPLRMIQFFCKF